MSLVGQSQKVEFRKLVGHKPGPQETVQWSATELSGQAETAQGITQVRLVRDAEGHVVSYQRTSRSREGGKTTSRLDVSRTDDGYLVTSEELGALDDPRSLVCVPVHGVLDHGFISALVSVFDHQGSSVMLYETRSGEVREGVLARVGDDIRTLKVGEFTAALKTKDDAVVSLEAIVRPTVLLYTGDDPSQGSDQVVLGDRKWFRPSLGNQDTKRPAFLLIPDPLSAESADSQELLEHIGTLLSARGWVARRYPLSIRDGLATASEDLRDGLKVLAADAQVDGDRLGVIATGAAAVATVHALTEEGAPKVRGLVSLGTFARPLKETLMAAYAERARKDEASSETIGKGKAAIAKDMESLQKQLRVGLAGYQRFLSDLLGIQPIDLYLKFEGRHLLLFGDEDIRIPNYHRALLGNALAIRGTSLQEFQILPGTAGSFRAGVGGAADPSAEKERGWSQMLDPALTEFLDRLVGGPVDK